MRWKDTRFSSPHSARDPLVWLKTELQREGAEGEVSTDLLKELESLAELLSKGNARSACLSDDAVEALVEMLPSESLTNDFLERVNQRRKALIVAQSPGAVLGQLRKDASVSLQEAAEVLATSVPDLQKVEQGTAPWYRLAADRFPQFARLVNITCDLMLDSLRNAARTALMSQVEDRLQLSLGRYDDLKSGSQMRLDAVKAALAMVKDENRAAAAFFRDVELVMRSRGT
jgi:DNA-binding transcriptional regulator YiaG